MRLTVIGRNPQDANIVLNSQYISNYHAEIIQLDNGDIFLVDKSTNGTYLNGTKLTPGKEVAIRRGDSILFADVPLDWSLIDEIRIPKDVKQIMSIGSHYMNTINVQGPNVSRFHATIRKMADGKWYICDHSKNGTTVNGIRIQKDRYVLLKKGDEISCAGVPIQNPIPNGGFNWKIAGTIAAAFAVVMLVIGLIGGDIFPPSAQKIYSTNEGSVAIVRTEYHFKVTCPGLNLEKLGIPTEFYIDEDGEFCRYDGKNHMATYGTGFFIGESKNIVTNRHVAHPWEATEYSTSSGPVTIIELAEIVYRRELTDVYHYYSSAILPYISQIKVEGYIDNTIVIPNGKYIDSSNLYACHELVCSSKEEDIAIFQVRNSMVTSAVTSIPIKKISDTPIKVGAKIYTLGFPLGLSLQNYTNVIQANFAAGEISRNNDNFKLGFTAPSNHGASGSPVFDNRGNLIGIVNSGVEATDGFNFAIKAQYLKALIEKNNIN